MKKLFSITLRVYVFVFVSGLLPVLFSCCTGTGPAETQVIIFHTNDAHAKIDNFAKIAWFVDRERKNNPRAHVFFMNAGDNFSGNPVVDQYDPKGEPVRQLLNLMGYDVMTLGNHEFDYGQEILKNMMEKAAFPIICANVGVQKASLSQPRPFTILKTKKGLKVAVLGLIQVEGDNRIPSTHPDGVAGLIFSDPLETAKKYRYLKKESDLFIALDHLGYEDDERLAQEMGELDLIIGGHSHTEIANPKEINGVLIAQAGENAEYLGRIEVIFQDGRPVKKSGRLIEVAAIKGEIPQLKNMIAKFNDNPVLKQVIAVLPCSPEGKFQLGHLLTDAVRKVYKLDIAFHNSGGIRSDRLEREVRLADIYTLHPFGNQVVEFAMTPGEIRTLIKNDYERHKDLDLKVSGIRYTVMRTLNHKVKAIELRDRDGKELDENKTYTVGMNDYISGTYKFSHRDAGKSLMVSVSDALIRYLKEGQAICADIGGIRTAERLVAGDEDRLTRIGKSTVEISAGADPFSGSTTAGNLAADAIRAATVADIAVYPSYLQRRGLMIPAASPFFREYVVNLYRFSQENRTITARMKGRDLMRFILERIRYKRGADLQVSGMKYTIYLRPDDTVAAVDCFLPGGEKIADTAVYTVSFNDYEFNNHYKLGPVVLHRSPGERTVEQIITAYIAKKGTIPASIGEARIKIIKNKK